MLKKLIFLAGIILNCSPVLSQTIDNNIVPEDSFNEIFKPSDIKLNVNDFDKRIQNLSLQVAKNLENSTTKQTECNRSILNNLTSTRSKLPRGLHDEIFFLEGLTFESCNEFEKANSSYNKSLKLRRNNPFVLYRMTSILFRNNNFNDAAIVIQEAEWQGFKEMYLLNFLKGVIKVAEDKYSDAIGLFQQSLFLNPNFVPAAKAQYQTRTQYRKIVKDPKIIDQLEKDIPIDLARLVSLEPDNRAYLLRHLKYLLSTGNILKNPQKLTEGLSLVEKQLIKSNINFADFALIKVQFLEKLNRTAELMDFLNQLEKDKKITPNLAAKKVMLLEDQKEE